MVGAARSAALIGLLVGCAGRPAQPTRDEPVAVSVIDGGVATVVIDAGVVPDVDARYSEAALDQVAQLYEEHDWEIEPAMVWLVEHPQEARGPLREIVEKLVFEPGTKHAVMVLGRIGDARDVELLASALRRADTQTLRWAIAGALADHDSEEALVALVRALDEPQFEVVDAAVSALGDRKAESARARLEGMIDHPKVSTRLRVVKSLGKLGAAGSDAVLRKRARIETGADVKKALAALGY